MTIRPVRTDDGTTSYEVVLMDTLENGAGYCRYLFEEERLELVLESLTESEPLGFRLAGGPHALDCDGSCYDCLRDYSNADLHAILDWRLGLDLADIARSPGAQVSLDHSRWVKLAERAAQSFAMTINAKPKSFQSTWAAPHFLVHLKWEFVERSYMLLLIYMITQWPVLLSSQDELNSLGVA